MDYRGTKAESCVEKSCDGSAPVVSFHENRDYRMFEYDAETRMYRCFYAHDPGVDLMKFMTCFNVRSVPGVRMHLLDSGSSLFLTPHKDALILGIKTVMNIRGVGGDVAKIKSPLVYTFLDSKGEYVGFHYQSLYLLESLSSDAQLQVFTGCPKDSKLFQRWRAEGGLFKGYVKCLTTGAWTSHGHQ